MTGERRLRRLGQAGAIFLGFLLSPALPPAFAAVVFDVGVLGLVREEKAPTTIIKQDRSADRLQLITVPIWAPYLWRLFGLVRP